MADTRSLSDTTENPEPLAGDSITAEATPLPWQVGFGIDESIVENKDNRQNVWEDERHYITSLDDAAPVVVRGGSDSWGIPQGVVSEADARLIVHAVNRLGAEAAQGAAPRAEGPWAQRAIERMLRAADTDTRYWIENIVKEEQGAAPRAEGLPSEALARAIHHAMCEVSHHDSVTVCKNQRKYEMVAESVARHLEGAAPRAEGLPDVDVLANIIREVDGDHSLGAGALAERILARLSERTE